MKVVIPTYNRCEDVANFISSENLQNIEVVDDASSNNGALFSEGFSRYCVDHNVTIIRNSQNLGLIGNHNSIGKAANGKLLFLINDDDYISGTDIRLLRDLVTGTPGRYFLKIIENCDDRYREISFPSRHLNSRFRIVRVCQFLFSQHDWFLHGVCYGEDLDTFSGFFAFPKRPDLWGRIVTFDVLLNAGIGRLDVPYIYSGDSQKHYEKKASVIYFLVFLLVRLAETHYYFFKSCLSCRAVCCAVLVPLALVYSYFQIISRGVRFLFRGSS